MKKYLFAITLLMYSVPAVAGLHLLEIDEVSVDYKNYKTPADISGGYKESFTYKDITSHTIDFKLPQPYQTQSVDLDMKLTLLQVFFLNSNLQIMGVQVNFENIDAQFPVSIWHAAIGINVTSFIQVYYEHDSYPLFSQYLNQLWPQQNAVGVKVFLYKRDNAPDKSLLQI